MNRILTVFTLLLSFLIFSGTACQTSRVETGKNRQIALLEKYSPAIAEYGNESWKEMQEELKKQIQSADLNLSLYDMYCADIFLLKFGMWFSHIPFTFEHFMQDFFTVSSQNPFYTQPDHQQDNQQPDAVASLIQAMIDKPFFLLSGTTETPVNILGLVNNAGESSWGNKVQNALKQMADHPQDQAMQLYGQKAGNFFKLYQELSRMSSPDLKNLQQIAGQFQILNDGLQDLQTQFPADPMDWNTHFKTLLFVSDVFYQQVKNRLLKEYENALQTAEQNYAYLEQLNTINHLPEGSFWMAELEIVQ